MRKLTKRLTKAGLIKKLDKLVKEIVFARDNHCVTCPLWKEIKPNHVGSSVMQPGHFITRGSKSVKWDLRNVYQQCRTCNFLHEYHPEVMANYVLSILDIAGFEDLVRDGNTPKPSIKMYELEELYEKLLKEQGKNDKMNDWM